jgi:murein DD-endopeptidase MepM/ murein hydrolase activator NlpD
MFRRALLLAVILIFASASLVSAHWPVAYRYAWISQGYHATHRAIDIAAPCGVPVLSYSTGRTVFAGWRNNGGGWQVWTYNGRRLSDGRPVYSTYNHMSRVESWRGEVLSINEQIGRIGSTGHSTGCHLHFDMWLGYPWAAGSVRIDPRGHIMHGKWLPYRYR